MAQEKKNNGKNIPAMIIRGGTSKGPGRYRKHYSQLLAGKRFEQGQQCEFKMTVIPYECTPENWVAAAEKLAGKREKK